ncbi:unnamed protein product, partial [Prorocentrum cordatum]
LVVLLDRTSQTSEWMPCRPSWCSLSRRGTSRWPRSTEKPSASSLSLRRPRPFPGTSCVRWSPWRRDQVTKRRRRSTSSCWSRPTRARRTKSPRSSGPTRRTLGCARRRGSSRLRTRCWQTCWSRWRSRRLWSPSWCRSWTRPRTSTGSLWQKWLRGSADRPLRKWNQSSSRWQSSWTGSWTTSTWRTTGSSATQSSRSSAPRPWRRQSPGRSRCWNRSSRWRARSSERCARRVRRCRPSTRSCRSGSRPRSGALQRETRETATGTASRGRRLLWHLLNCLKSLSLQGLHALRVTRRSSRPPLGQPWQRRPRWRVDATARQRLPSIGATPAATPAGCIGSTSVPTGARVHQADDFQGSRRGAKRGRSVTRSSAAPGCSFTSSATTTCGTSGSSSAASVAPPSMACGSSI